MGTNAQPDPMETICPPEKSFPTKEKHLQDTLYLLIYSS